MDRFNVAVKVVQNAGNLLRQCRLEEAEVSQKTGHQDLVTRWDRRIEQLLRNEILTAFPQDAMFGLVLDVERKALYWGKHGGGAWQDQTPIHTSCRRELSELLLTTPGLQYTFLEPHPYQERMIRLSRKVRGVRCLGSVALELCEVAAGRADLFVTMRSSPWDHNAARIILEEAGGAIFTVAGDELPLEQKSTVLGLNSASLKEDILCG